MFRFSFGLLFTFCLTFHLSFAQQKNFISGKVIDSFGKEIEAANVYLRQLPDTITIKLAITNDKGNFSFSNLKGNGKYNIEIRALGYQKIIKGPYSFAPGISGIQTGNIFLIQSPQALNEVTIQEKRLPIEFRAGKTILNVSSSTLFTGNSAFEILQKAPGTRLTENDISMNGKKVAINIDGKSTYTSLSDLVVYLQSLPAATIESIDLVSNPPSAYDAAGSGGVINIHLKKDKNAGTNATFAISGGISSLGTSYDPNTRLNPSVNFNSRSRKINLFGNYSYNSYGQYRNLAIDRDISYQNEITSLDLYYLNNIKRINNFFRLGADYYITPSSTIGLNVNGNYTVFNYDKKNRSDFNSTNQLDSSIVGNALQKRTLANTGFNLNYRTAFEEIKGDLTIDVDYLTYNRESDEAINNEFIKPPDAAYRDDLNLLNSSPASYDIKSFKADYSQELNSLTSFTAGFKTSLVNNKSSLSLASLSGSRINLDPKFTSKFDYRENIYAGYASFDHSFKKLDLSLGLRVEKTVADGIYQDVDQVINRDYTDFFPNLTVVYAQGEKANFTLAYNRRINRPYYEDLNLFVAYLDQYNYRSGNPLLKPEYANTLQLSHSWANKFSAKASYTRTKDVLHTIVQQDDQTKILTVIRTNFDRSDIYGLYFNAPVQLNKWWNLNLNLEGLYMKYFNTTANGLFTNESPDVTLTALQNFKLKNNFTIDLLGSYETASVTGIYDYDPVYYVDIGFGKSFMSNNASLKLKIDDIFNTRKYRSTSVYQNLNLSQYDKTETRLAVLTFSMLIGKSSVKAVKNPASGIDAEQKRLGQ